MDQLLETNALDSFAKEWKAEGKKVLGTYCCHLPEEILYAADLLPYRIRGLGCKQDSEAEAYMSTFSCSFARACLQNFLDGTYDFIHGMVATDGCQMAQRIYDNWKALNKETHFCHQFVAPRVYDEKALGFYRTEIRGLKQKVERYSGCYVTDERLKDAINVYNETRRLIQELYKLRMADAPLVTGEECLRIILAAMSMRKDQFNEMLSNFLQEAKNREPITGYRARLMLIGSTVDDPEYLKIFEDKGGLFVTDVQCYGSRYLWEPVEITDNDLLMSLAKSYLKRPACPRMLNLHDELLQFILQMAKDAKVDGVVYVKMKNCDVWGGESTLIDDKIKSAGIPMLILEREEIVSNAGQVGIRVEAFLEMIEEGGLNNE